MSAEVKQRITLLWCMYVHIWQAMNLITLFFCMSSALQENGRKPCSQRFSFYYLGVVRNHFSVSTISIGYRKRGKKLHTVPQPAMRSVNKSGNTRNWVRNEPQYAIYSIFIMCIIINPENFSGLNDNAHDAIVIAIICHKRSQNILSIFCDLLWQILAITIVSMVVTRTGQVTTRY